MNTATDLAKAFRRFERALSDLEVKVSDETMDEVLSASAAMRAAFAETMERAMERAKRGLKVEVMARLDVEHDAGCDYTLTNSPVDCRCGKGSAT